MERVPSRAAVALSIPEGSTSTYAEVLREAVQVDIKGTEISGVCPGPSASEGLLLKVLGGWLQRIGLPTVCPPSSGKK